ncbi:elastase-1-like [Engraulis encrasicolus]|uniref:elastase-1-like n=1 Tax=Engraulis encrasicolus TaxID=184585 RepID=UPI002FD01BD3
MQSLLFVAAFALFSASVFAEEKPKPLVSYLEDAEGIVVGGSEAHANAWPWQVSLQVKYGSYYYHICGGSLIRKGWVLTAAHCVDSPQTWQVVLGEHDLNSESGREQNIAVSRAILHPKWDTQNVAGGYDIALLQLSEPATLNNYVQLAKLPPSGKRLSHNHPCYVTGWGRTVTGGDSSPVLKQAYLPVVSMPTCTKDDWWGATVTRKMVCAGGNGRDSGCQGDSGGPLNCRECDKWYVNGIVSFGSGHCNEKQKPTVFTRVSYYIKWITRNAK